MNTATDFYNLAVEAHQSGDLDSAESAYKKCIDLNHQYVDALHMLGVLLGQKKSFDTSIHFLEIALSLSPQNLQIHQNLYMAHKKKGSLKQALECLCLAIEAFPDQDSFYLQKGRIMREWGDYLGAIDAFNELLSIFPAHSEGHYLLGIVYAEINHHRQAQRCFSTTLALDPGFSQAQSELEKLKEVEYQKIQNPDSPPKFTPLGSSLESAYLDLLKHSLCDTQTSERFEPDHHIQKSPITWPLRASTMIGYDRLSHIQRCIDTLLKEKISGDLIETGVWRGGATLFMRAVLMAHGDTQRKVWLADTFEGLPTPNEKAYPADEGGLILHQERPIAVSQERVEIHFNRYDLLDEQVAFLPGLFKDTLPQLKEETFALVRLDGDMYESTMDALVHLYPRLAKGGYLIVDDYGDILACKQAVHDFLEAQHLQVNMTFVDHTCVAWRKE